MAVDIGRREFKSVLGGAALQQGADFLGVCAAADCLPRSRISC